MIGRILLWSFLIAVLVACARPAAQFTYEDTSYQVFDSISFNNLSADAELFRWDFGDGDTSNVAFPTHQFNRSGNYEVTLYASKGAHTDTIQKRILVRASDHCLVELETSFGTMVLELYEDTPIHLENFSKLVEGAYYDGLLFHRVIEGFMIQGGDPNSRNAQSGSALGMGGPGYTIPNELDAGHIHLSGALAAARTGDSVNPNRESSGSQFYIVHGSKLNEEMLESIQARNGMNYSPEQRAAYLEYGGTPFLDGQYTVFGRVISGLDVIEAIATVQKDPNNRPIDDVAMKMRFID